MATGGELSPSHRRTRRSSRIANSTSDNKDDINKIRRENAKHNEGENDVEYVNAVLFDDIKEWANKAISTREDTSAIDLELTKLIAIMLNARGISCTIEVLDLLTNLCITYFDDLISLLHKLAEYLRRRKPSFNDINLCFSIKKIKPFRIGEEYLISKQVSSVYKKEVGIVTRQVNELTSTLAGHSISENDAALPFFVNDHYEMSQLVPRRTERPKYIPSYLPDLPPDYTYQNTSDYLDIMSEKEARLKLVEQSRLTEQSLYKLIDDDYSQWRTNFESQLNDLGADSDNEDSIMSDVAHDQKTDVETPAPELERIEEKSLDGNNLVLAPGSTRFDFVAYAKKRALIKQRKEEEIELKRERRRSNIFMKAEKLYSPYAKSFPTLEDNEYFRNIVQQEFKSVIKSVRSAEKIKKKRIDKILKEKAEKARNEKESGTKEFTFNFNHISDPLGIDSDESDDNNVPDFDTVGRDNDSEKSHTSPRETLENHEGSPPQNIVQPLLIQPLVPHSQPELLSDEDNMEDLLTQELAKAESDLPINDSNLMSLGLFEDELDVDDLEDV
ncbi:uncharacterized protein PRCAT00004710001 [Priceomyces carsonii]|uniref:uncharacterized protein n=1 Tax=Priceomyces carsonii TaxID=28549 RepID=UPI002ED85CF2|nr:unnamed protein product [Priceomyces carsonii]